MASFVTIDFETANGDMASICQVGVVTYENGKETDRFSSLVTPEEPFWHTNVAVHRIRHPERSGNSPKKCESMIQRKKCKHPFAETDKQRTPLIRACDPSPAAFAKMANSLHAS
jgi:DNA polymerase-3 subunit epsilon